MYRGIAIQVRFKNLTFIRRPQKSRLRRIQEKIENYRNCSIVWLHLGCHVLPVPIVARIN
jgi:hypothetical protein